MRIISNYLRMAVTFSLGLWFVRLMIEMDESVFAVVTLVGASVGISGMLREMMRGSIIPELGLAWHSGDMDRFSETFATSFWLSLFAAFIAMLILGLIYVFLPSLSIPPELLPAAGIFLLSRMAHTFIAIALAPCTNLLPITGRMGQMNFWMTTERTLEVLGAFFVLVVFTDTGAAEQLELFAYISAAAMVFTTLCWAFDGMRSNQHFRIRPNQATRSKARDIASTMSWNGFVVVAMNLYERFDMFFMNIFFGVAGTVIFGIATQLLAYLRMLTVGLVQGLDATMSRLSSTTNDKDAQINTLLSNTGRLEGLTTLSAASLLFVHSGTVIDLWVGSRLNDPTMLPQAALIFQIMLTGMIARSLSEGWMKYLSGVGKVRTYGPLLLVSALTNPILVFVLFNYLPQDIAYLCAALAYTLLLSLTHALFLPRVVSLETGLSLTSLWKPKVLPLALAVCATVICYLISMIWNLTPTNYLIASIGVYGVVFGPFFLRSLARL